MSAIAVQATEDGLLVVDSRLIADALGIEHRHFLRTLDTYKTQIEQAFGILRFENAEIDGRGRPGRYALLTENQAIFVMTLSRNTEKVVQCKIGLVQAFDRAKQALRSGHILLEGSDRPFEDPETRLARLEQQIRAGFAKIEDGERDVWLAVGEIRREKLWLAKGFKSFKEYVIGHWKWNESYAHEIATAGEMIEILMEAGIPDEDLPTAVSQVRPLTKLDRDEVPTAWRKALKESRSSQKITAKLVRETITPRALPSESSKCQISVWLDPEMKRLLEEQADLEGRSLSNMASYYLEEALCGAIERRAGVDRLN